MYNENQSQPPRIRITEKRMLTSDIRNRPEPERVPKRLLWAVVIIAVVVVAGAIFLYIRSQQQLNSTKQQLQDAQSDPTVKIKEANAELISKVGKLIILPKDEEPTIATVSDLTKLQGQPFFAKAELGDKVLIYQKDRKAILYRPSTNQIIELAPLNSSSEPGTPTESAPQQTPSSTPAL